MDTRAIQEPPPALSGEGGSNMISNRDDVSVGPGEGQGLDALHDLVYDSEAPFFGDFQFHYLNGGFPDVSQDLLEDPALFFDFSALDHESSNPPGSSASHGRPLHLIDIAEPQASLGIVGKEPPEKESYLCKTSPPRIARPTLKRDRQPRLTLESLSSPSLFNSEDFAPMRSEGAVSCVGRGVRSQSSETMSGSASDQTAGDSFRADTNGSPVSSSRSHESALTHTLPDPPSTDTGSTARARRDAIRRPKPRGPFRDPQVRLETARTRRLGACIRCRMQRIRVSGLCSYFSSQVA